MFVVQHCIIGFFNKTDLRFALLAAAVSRYIPINLLLMFCLCHHVESPTCWR